MANTTTAKVTAERIDNMKSPSGVAALVSLLKRQEGSKFYLAIRLSSKAQELGLDKESEQALDIAKCDECGRVYCDHPRNL